MIVEESKEQDEDSHSNGSNKENNDPSKTTHSRVREQYEEPEEIEGDEDLNHYSPPNKLPDSFVESRGSILPSEASSHKRDTINIFDTSD